MRDALHGRETKHLRRRRERLGVLLGGSGLLAVRLRTLLCRLLRLGRLLLRGLSRGLLRPGRLLLREQRRGRLGVSDCIRQPCSRYRGRACEAKTREH